VCVCMCMCVLAGEALGPSWDHPIGTRAVQMCVCVCVCLHMYVCMCVYVHVSTHFISHICMPSN
jgi:hypothetical protein